MLVTYNISIYICKYIFEVSYIHYFLLSLTVMLFLHCMLNILRYEKTFCEIDESIALWRDPSSDVIFLGLHSESIFPFMEFFFSQENCVSFGLLVSCLSLSQSA